MNDYLVAPIIFVIFLFFFFTYMIIDNGFHKVEMRDIGFKSKLESIERELDRVRDDIRRK